MLCIRTICLHHYDAIVQAGDRVGGWRLSSGCLEPPQATSGHLPQTAQDNVPEKCGLSKRISPWWTWQYLRDTFCIRHRSQYRANTGFSKNTVLRLILYYMTICVSPCRLGLHLLWCLKTAEPSDLSFAKTQSGVSIANHWSAFFVFLQLKLNNLVTWLVFARWWKASSVYYAKQLLAPQVL